MVGRFHNLQGHDSVFLFFLTREARRFDKASSDESGGVGSKLKLGREESGDEEVDVRWSRTCAGGGVAGDCCGGCDGGKAATTISEAPENHTRGIGSLSRHPLSNISATVHPVLRLGGVATGSTNAFDSTRHARGTSAETEIPLSKVGGNTNERRNVSMLSRRRFATELRGRGGSRCTRWALMGGALEKGEPVSILLNESSEPKGVDVTE